MPKEISYGALITLKNHKTGGGYLHSHYHLYPKGSGAKQQQVTLIYPQAFHYLFDFFAISGHNVHPQR